MLAKQRLVQEIILRPITKEDDAFLHRLYAQTRQKELALVPWSQEQKDLFTQQQFFAQTTDWGRNYNTDRFSVILWKKQVVGRFYVEEKVDQLLLVDIIVHQDFRKKGIGGYLIKELLKEAQTKQLPVKLHVEADNWVKKYYEGLGFKLTKFHEVYSQMIWKPQVN